MELEINEKVSSLPHGRAAPSERVVALAEMFGIGLDERHELALYRDVRLRIRRGDVVYVTGPSGCGKSVLLRAVASQLAERFARGDVGEGDPQPPLAAPAEVDLGGSAPVVDRFPVGLDEALRLAGVAGLSDAFLLLRPPSELSDGQRYRYRLAALLAGGARTILIDEFCSTHDRRTARAVAYRIRKYADRSGATFIVATAHDDLAEDLVPDVIVRKQAAGQVDVRSMS